MELTKYETPKAVAENLGKVYLNLGQGMILGGFLSRFFDKEIHLPEALIPFALGAITIYVGLYIIAGVENLEE